ncbi:MAG: hypothetical protein HY368_00035 [Candidatus Aenigmarchaeota archaeon]|nr:hypothetical protein [Candidatus Aenigmarchaeota archaeon]
MPIYTPAVNLYHWVGRNWGWLALGGTLAGASAYFGLPLAGGREGINTWRQSYRRPGIDITNRDLRFHEFYRLSPTEAVLTTFDEGDPRDRPVRSKRITFDVKDLGNAELDRFAKKLENQLNDPPRSQVMVRTNNVTQDVRAGGCKLQAREFNDEQERWLVVCSERVLKLTKYPRPVTSSPYRPRTSP